MATDSSAPDSPETPVPGDDPRDAAAALLAVGRSQKRAAEAAGVHERTVRTWLADPVFQARVRELRRVAVAQFLGILSGAGVAAATVLRRLTTDATVPAAVRVAASKAILDSELKHRLADDLEARVAALEADRESEESDRSVGGDMYTVGGFGSGATDAGS